MVKGDARLTELFSLAANAPRSFCPAEVSMTKPPLGEPLTSTSASIQRQMPAAKNTDSPAACRFASAPRVTQNDTPASMSGRRPVMEPIGMVGTMRGTRPRSKSDLVSDTNEASRSRGECGIRAAEMTRGMIVIIENRESISSKGEVSLLD